MELCVPMLLVVMVTQMCFLTHAQFGRSSFTFHAPVSGSQLNARMQQRLASRTKTEDQSRLQATNQQDSISLTPQQLLKVDSLRLRGQRTSDLPRQTGLQDQAQSDTYLLGQTDSAPPPSRRSQNFDNLRGQQSLPERQELQRRQFQEQMSSSYGEDPYAQQPRSQKPVAQQRQSIRSSLKQKYFQDLPSWQNAGDSRGIPQSVQTQYSDQIPMNDPSTVQDQGMKQNSYPSRLQDQYNMDAPQQSFQNSKQSQYLSKNQPINPNQYLIVSDHPQNTGPFTSGVNQVYDHMPVGGQFADQLPASASSLASESMSYRPRMSDMQSQQMMSSGLSRSSADIQTLQQHISQYPGQQSQYNGQQYLDRQSQFADPSSPFLGQQSQYAGRSMGGQYMSGSQASSMSSQSGYPQPGAQDMISGPGGSGLAYDQQPMSSQTSMSGASASAMGGPSSGIVATSGSINAPPALGSSSSAIGASASGMTSVGGASSGIGGIAGSSAGGAYSGTGAILNTSTVRPVAG
ncbi:protein lingerer-like isoform X2 [Biomphalaria glabrata]|uniref:Protein lingerer-like isoform X2 n=1 Tax=Biomphalaria glabrata TaxID=6526 RepID=A0A9W2YJI8_BIOGL|nr:protein lingerer-like isoform X2 [Biomphalaria glabrata]